MNFGLRLGLQLPYGELLRPLDLCMRLDNNEEDQQQQQQTATTVILQPPPPLLHQQPQLLQSSSSTNNLTEKTGVQNLMQIRNQTPLTPSPSSSSSFENDEDMGYVGPPPFSIYRRQPSSSVQVAENFV